ncbi:MAG: hypothetical protein US14_C0003G0018 [candidate division WS6 bacterium GW2011_WS6_36_26]|nr:MAG: hypothetical protein US14_C0003G0018 [candidate division WS6 bacterium GW2011_WS6_36_26]
MEKETSKKPSFIKIVLSILIIPSIVTLTQITQNFPSTWSMILISSVLIVPLVLFLIGKDSFLKDREDFFGSENKEQTSNILTYILLTWIWIIVISVINFLIPIL